MFYLNTFTTLLIKKSFLWLYLPVIPVLGRLRKRILNLRPESIT
jgi:hypothetical protein